MPVLDPIDRSSIFCRMTVPPYMEWVEEILSSYITETYKEWEETETTVKELEPLSGREGDINDAYLMLRDLAEKLDAYPKRVAISARKKVLFNANRRSAAVRLWRAVHKVVITKKDP
jgi:hypothetical protein